MNAEQWIKHINETEGSEYSSYDCNFVLMERYKNYHVRGLHAALCDFRNRILLNGGMYDFSILKRFDDCFDIREVKGGQDDGRNSN